MENHEFVETDVGAGLPVGDRVDSGVPMDAVFLDSEIRAVLDDEELDPEQRWIHYYLCVQRYLYKRDPSHKPHHIKFKTSEGRNGRVQYSVKDSPWYRQRAWRRFHWLTSLFGPVLGALCSVCLRTREFC